MAEATAPAKEQIVTLLRGATGESIEIRSQVGAAAISAKPGQVVLGNAQVFPGTDTFRAFVATDSKSPFIFGTLAETRGVLDTTMYCGPRNFGSRDGILVTLFVRGGIPGDVIVIVTLMQEGATGYASPVLYTGM